MFTNTNRTFFTLQSLLSILSLRGEKETTKVIVGGGGWQEGKKETGTALSLHENKFILFLGSFERIINSLALPLTFPFLYATLSLSLWLHLKGACLTGLSNIPNWLSDFI